MPLSYSIAGRNEVDAAAVARLLAACDTDLDYLFANGEQLRRYCDKIASKAQFFQCTSADRLAGFAAVYCNDFETKTAFLTMICVRSGFRGQGIANKLLRMAIEHVQSLGFERFASRVATHNKASLSLHFGLGFAVQQTIGREIHLSKAL